MKEPSLPPAAFDRYAGAYDTALEQGLSVSGENKTFFARGRVDWLSRSLTRLGESPRTVLDFGCGTGTSTPLLADLPGVQSALGVDISSESIEVARRDHGSERIQFEILERCSPVEQYDLAFCNGVFHHIPLEQRLGAVAFVSRALRPGGLFALWENNPWNPGTRYIMRRIPFDRDALPLTCTQARALVKAGGFTVLSTEFLFVFPRFLRWLRFIEPSLARMPLGAQYLVLCRK
jgi:SAM-dependent methyltransferase